jgi:hypothetical protein
MAWRFWTGPEGLIWADLGDGREVFNEALNDTISALSPRGEEPALSTYWIDHALDNVRRPNTDGDAQISSGNATVLFRKGSRVRAESLYDTLEAEWMDVSEFEQGLHDWRAEVDRARRSGMTVASDQSNYQRNPWPT